MDNLENKLVEHGLDILGRYYSSYLGVVVDINDVENMDRIKVFVPSIQVTAWALPRNQHGSHNSGFRLFTLPNISDIVRVTFEDGNPSRPLWEWHGWARDQKPDDLNDPDVCGIVTPGGIKVLINDKAREVLISSGKGVTIRALDKESVIALNADKIKLMSNTSVEVNNANRGGIVNINELTEKLNNLVTELESIKQKINTHTHPGNVMGVSFTTLTPTTPVTDTISNFKKEDYEDTSFLH